MADRQTARRSRSREPHEMLASDVGSEEAGSNRQPTYISTREEVIRADVFLFTRRPVGDPRQDEEIRGNDENVDGAEVAHGVSSVREKCTAEPFLRYAPRPLRAEFAKNLWHLQAARYDPAQMPGTKLLRLTGHGANPTFATTPREGMHDHRNHSARSRQTRGRSAGWNALRSSDSWTAGPGPGRPRGRSPEARQRRGWACSRA